MMIKGILTFIFLLFAGLAGAQNTERVFSNSFFSINRHPSGQGLLVLSARGDTLISSIRYAGHFIRDGGKDTVNIEGVTASRIVKLDLEGGVQMTWTGLSEISEVSIHFSFLPSSDEIKIETVSRFKTDVQVIREVLIFTSAQPVTEVYRRNRVMDTTDFQNEYWLDKEGMKFGSGDKTFFIYHAPGISSLQLNTTESELVVNLDYEKDHPFQHFPLLDSAMNKKIDLSCSIFKKGESRKNYFSIRAGRETRFIPRLMLSPDGFVAAHVFTEHADWTDLPSHRAVYFGSEEIENSSAATGGFVKNKIPVTKSVFYSNPDSVLNSQARQKSIFVSPIASIRGTRGFLKFLNQLGKEGSEICLHTPDQFTANTLLVNEACTFMSRKFKSVTWIDHGYNNGPKNNREAFVCDGLNPASSSFAGNIWEKTGVKYFWNSYYEDFATADSLFFDFNSSPMHPYPGFGDAAPAPLFWKHPTRTGNFYSWPTRDLLEMPNPNSWGFHFSKDRMNDIVKNRSVKFEHCYPAGSTPDKGFWKRDASNTLVIEPEFEKVLGQLAAFRDRGLINLTTVRSLLDYWIACEQIRFEYLDDGAVRVVNESGRKISGLSFVVNAKKVVIESKTIDQKAYEGDLIFWFDLKSGEKVVMKLNNN